MKCGVGGPHIHADPAGPVVAPGTMPGPVQQRSTKAVADEAATDDQAIHIHGLIPLGLGRPDGVYLAVSGDCRGSYVVLPGNPGISCDQIPADSVTAVLLAGPRLRPLISVL